LQKGKLDENWVIELVQNQTNSANQLCPTLVPNDIEKKQAMNSKGQMNERETEYREVVYKKDKLASTCCYKTD
jgi:hypothetical protein